VELQSDREIDHVVLPVVEQRLAGAWMSPGCPYLKLTAGVSEMARLSRMS
jgi:hypothetical protein